MKTKIRLPKFELALYRQLKKMVRDYKVEVIENERAAFDEERMHFDEVKRSLETFAFIIKQVKELRRIGIVKATSHRKSQTSRQEDFSPEGYVAKNNVT